MSLKALANKVLSREHGNEHAVNTEQKSCSRTVNTGLSSDLPLGSGERDVTLSPAGEVWTCSGCGQPVPLTDTSESGYKHFVCQQCGSFRLVPPEPGKSYVRPAEKPWTPGKRDFLSRPLDQEDNPDVWDAWGPFMGWLREHHEEQFTAICSAEDALTRLERRGILSGPTHEGASRELARRFEEGRRLRFRETVRVWTQ